MVKFSRIVIIAFMIFILQIKPIVSFTEVPRYQISQKIEYEGRNLFLNVSQNRKDDIVFQVRVTEKGLKALQASATLESGRLHVKSSDLETFNEIFKQPKSTTSGSQVKVLSKGWLYDLVSHYADLLIVHSEFLIMDLSKDLISISIEESGIYPFEQLIQILKIPEINLQELKMDRRNERDDIVSAFRLSNKNIKMYMNFIISR